MAWTKQAQTSQTWSDQTAASVSWSKTPAVSGVTALVRVDDFGADSFNDLSFTWKVRDEFPWYVSDITTTVVVLDSGITGQMP